MWQITTSFPIRICATLLLILAIVGGRGVFVLEQLRGVGNGQIWMHMLPGLAALFFAGLWLLFVTPVITVPCAALVSLHGLWIIWSACTGFPADDRGAGILLGIILFIPAAIESGALSAESTQ